MSDDDCPSWLEALVADVSDCWETLQIHWSWYVEDELWIVKLWPALHRLKGQTVYEANTLLHLHDALSFFDQVVEVLAKSTEVVVEGKKDGHEVVLMFCFVPPESADEPEDDVELPEMTG